MKNILVALLLVGLLMPVCAPKADADFAGGIKSTTGVISGLVLGTPVGAIRGLSSGWLKGTKATAEALGDSDGIPHNVIGFVSGGVVTGAAGGVSGIFMGGYDAFKYGIDDPWSPENFSAGGVDLLDYDPFDWK